MYFVDFPLLLNVYKMRYQSLPGYFTVYFMYIKFLSPLSMAGTFVSLRVRYLGKSFGGGRTSHILQMKKFKTSENEQSHGSFFLRVGGLGKDISF